MLAVPDGFAQLEDRATSRATTTRGRMSAGMFPYRTPAAHPKVRATADDLLSRRPEHFQADRQ
jgi:hypothetical protein